MHSSLRKELYGTSKVLRSLRTHPARLAPTSSRRFSSRTRLFNQPGSKDSGASHTGSKLPVSDDPKDAESNSSASARSFSVDQLEKCIQRLSDCGQATHICDALSEKDENGKRTILPKIRKELEKPTQNTAQHQTAPQIVGLEIQDGNVRRLTPADLEQEKSSQTDDAESTERFILQPDGNGNITATQKSLQPSLTPEKTSHGSGQEKSQEQGQEASQTNTAGGEAPNVDVDHIFAPRFHGSSAARRQRERQSRFKERTQSVILPEWFYERNVMLWGERRIDPSLWRTDKSPNMLRWKSGQFAEEPAQPASVPNSADPEDPRTLNESGNRNTESITPEGEKGNETADAGGEEPTSHGNQPAASNSPSNPSPRPHTLLPLPNSQKRYYIQAAQSQELHTTVRGRLRLPKSPGNRSPSIRSHLLVHYTAQDGDIFLDRLIEAVAGVTRANLITLDAQDIAALISKADIDPMMTAEAKNLSYDIYSDIYDEDPTPGEEIEMFNDDVEDAEEDGGPGGRAGIPFIMGKPIAIDLKAIFNPQHSDRPRSFARRDAVSQYMNKDRFLEVLGPRGTSRQSPHLLQSLVESILSSPNNRRKPPNSESLQQKADERVRENSYPVIIPDDATIVHVKDLKAIQETSIGKAFLYQLYEQVDRRRSHGEGIMLIGTSCDRGNTTYNADSIGGLQVSDADQISSTILITPAYPKNPSETDSETGLRNEIQRTVIPKQDRATRIKTINARHLYDMLQTKDVPLGKLKDGFWTKSIDVEQLDQADLDCLSKSFWNFAYVQRIAAAIAGQEIPDESRPISLAVSRLELSDKQKISWAKQAQDGKSKRNKGKISDEPENEKLAQIRQKATTHEKKLLGGVVEPKKIRTTFQDIHIPAETIEALQTLTTLSLVRPDAFKYGVLASDRIPGLLLYGPPGTGKTLAAKAVARESGATMLEVSAADINDMYVGEGEKNVKALFSLAKKLSPCVVFLDEADAMFSARSQTSRRVSHRETLNQFLKEWDGMSNDSGSAFIMVATNRPMDLDDAVLRRLPRRLLVDLPTEKDRLEILKIHLRHEHLAPDVDLARLASQTQFYSGSDLKNVAVAAALNCVREENALAKAHTGTDEPYRYPEKRVLTMLHFEKALEEITASISEDMSSLREIKKFDEQYGDKRGRKRRSPKWGFKSAAEADKVLDTVKVRS